MATTTCAITVVRQSSPPPPDVKRMVPLKPPRSLSHERRKSHSSTTHQDEDITRPYRDLLMPMPRKDHDFQTAEDHLMEIRTTFLIVFGKKRNKNCWRSIPTFSDDETEEFLPPLTPLEGEFSSQLGKGHEKT